MRPRGLLVRHAVHFHADVAHHPRLHADARRGVFGLEIAGVDLVEAREVARVVQPDGHAHDIRKRIAGAFHSGFQVVERHRGLDGDAAGDDLAVLVAGHLAAHEEPAAGADGPGEGQRAGRRGCAETGDGHGWPYFVVHL